MWLSHKLADAVFPVVSVTNPGTVLANSAVGRDGLPRPPEFVATTHATVTIMSLGPDDGGPTV
jgi:hypothetical protein